MIGRWSWWLIGVVIITACVGTQRNQVKKLDSPPDKSVDTVLLRIHAVDLTENMSSLSSQNDEISLFGSVANDSLKQVNLLFVKSFMMTNKKNTPATS